MPDERAPPLETTADRTARAVFLAFLRLGLTAFGGPIAHIGWFREEFVVRRRWLDERAYADLVALCQFLPGPASSQVGIALGLGRAGLPGAFAAWIGFTLPSAILLVLAAEGFGRWHDALPAGLLHGLEVVAVAVVAQAVLGMARSLAPDLPRRATAAVAAAVVLALPGATAQVGVILGGALLGLALPREGAAPPVTVEAPVGGGTRAGRIALALFAVVLVGLPIATALLPWHVPALVDAFWRAGALVFGGGHVVLPLLRSMVVDPGWVSEEAFLVGYAAAQAVPGPLFTFAAWLGAVAIPPPNGWAGATIALVAVFAPSFLLVIGVLPHWARLRANATVRRALRGVDAAVVGLLAAALIFPVGTAGVRSPADAVLAATAFGALHLWKRPPWLVVAATAAAAVGLSRLGIG
ncbi:MAG: chromate efflux transporter [Siculibacillus sp.]